MKVLFVNKPIQNFNTKEPQIFDGKIYHWCVNAEMLKPDETFQQWWERKQEYMITYSKNKDIKLPEGIFFYDIQPVGQILGKTNKGKGAMIIRYGWIKNTIKLCIY